MSVQELFIDAQTGEQTTAEMSAEDVAEREANQAAQAPMQLRAQRNRMLQETDIYALGDRTMSDEMRTYRQALRDLPANTSDPSNPTWPTRPNE